MNVKPAPVMYSVRTVAHSPQVSLPTVSHDGGGSCRVSVWLADRWLTSIGSPDAVLVYTLYR